MIIPAKFSECVGAPPRNTSLRVHGASLRSLARIQRRLNQCPAGLSLPSRQSVSEYTSKVVAGPAGPLSCSSMRLQRQVCSSCPPFRPLREQVIAGLAWPVVAPSRPARSQVGSSAGWAFRAIAHRCQASASCSPVRPNPSVKGTSCGKPQAAPYVER